MFYKYLAAYAALNYRRLCARSNRDGCAPVKKPGYDQT
jgi:hypothetical protein